MHEESDAKDPRNSAKERAKAKDLLQTPANVDDVQVFEAQRAKLASETEFVQKQLRLLKEQSEKLTVAQTEFQRRKNQHRHAAAQDRTNYRSLAEDFVVLDPSLPPRIPEIRPYHDSNGNIVYETPADNMLVASEVLKGTPLPHNLDPATKAQLKIIYDLCQKAVEQQAIATSSACKLVSDPNRCYTGVGARPSRNLKEDGVNDTNRAEGSRSRHDKDRESTAHKSNPPNQR